MKAVLLTFFMAMSHPDIKVIQETYYCTRAACEIQEGIINYKASRWTYPKASDYTHFKGLIVYPTWAKCDDLPPSEVTE